MSGGKCRTVREKQGFAYQNGDGARHRSPFGASGQERTAVEQCRRAVEQCCRSDPVKQSVFPTGE
ncbi:hypothetical protein DWW59_11615 [Firmicutes bacterium AF16-15]|nr:hypothetical protein DWW59_11615 [Firmicutes bacterium AF16-15]RHU28507.1 hypothetical protein DXD76_05400 [Firmicutes bacterium TM09-10]